MRESNRMNHKRLSVHNFWYYFVYNTVLNGMQSYAAIKSLSDYINEIPDQIVSIAPNSTPTQLFM